MSGLLDAIRRRLCCRPPGRVIGLVALTGGGSGEVIVAWSPSPPADRVAAYRVYRRTAPGVWRLLALVEPGAGDPAAPGKVAMLDFPGNFPGGSDFGPAGERTYVVTAINRAGQEGPPSFEVVGTPP